MYIVSKFFGKYMYTNLGKQKVVGGLILEIWLRLLLKAIFWHPPAMISLKLPQSSRDSSTQLDLSE